MMMMMMVVVVVVVVVVKAKVDGLMWLWLMQEPMRAA